MADTVIDVEASHGASTAAENVSKPGYVEAPEHRKHRSSTSSTTATARTDYAPDATSTNPNSIGPYGGNSLQLMRTSSGRMLPAFGGSFQPGSYKDYAKEKGIANPAPLGLAGFALTTFVLSLINLGTRGLAEANIVAAPAFAYGGLVQLLSGMWEIAAGNTFGGTALSSYGGFWISFGIVFTPGGFAIADAYGGMTAEFANAFGLYIFGWFIFTFILWTCTLKSTVAFSSLLLFVWLTYLMLGSAYVANVDGAANVALTRAGGAFGIIAAFLAWYNMLAGIADSSNSFFVIPVVHFPWSDKVREKKKADRGKDVEKQD